MASKKRYDPGPTDKPGTGDQDQSSVSPPETGARAAVQPAGASGGVTDIGGRDGEADDSDSGYSDEDLLRTGGGARH